MKDHAKKPLLDPRKTCEEKLDEAIEDSFPASDPLPTNPTFAGGPDHTGRAGAEPKAGRHGRRSPRNK